MPFLDPGSTPRRWEPDSGTRRYNEKIHRESKFADDHKKLPFKFSKPYKPGLTRYFECVECGNIINASKNTYMIICSVCKKAAKVLEL